MMIDNVEKLSRVMDEVRELGVVALDTEFVWERTYYAQLGLIQVGLGRKKAYLIDPVALKDLSLLGEVIADAGVVKILHDATQDLMILKRATGGHAPKNIFDTRLASGFMGMGSTISLRDLVNQMFKVVLNKSQTRTNWIKRPLTDMQIKYALNDVYYLIEAREQMLAHVEKNGYGAWLAEELKIYDNERLYDQADESSIYRKVKGRGKMTAKETAVLQSVAHWREKQAIKQDKPRSHVLADEVLVQMVRQMPKDVGRLRPGRSFSTKDIERYGAELVEAVAQAKDLDLDSFESSKSSSYESDQMMACVDFALAFLKGKGMQTGIDSALVGNRSDVVQLVKYAGHEKESGQKIMKGWRKDFAGQDITDLIEGKGAIKIDRELGVPVKFNLA